MKFFSNSQILGVFFYFEESTIKPMQVQLASAKSSKSPWRTQLLARRNSVFLCVCGGFSPVRSQARPVQPFWSQSLWGNIGAIVCLHFPPHPFCPEQNGSAKYTTESSLRASHLWHMNSLPLSVAMVSMCHLYFLCSPLLRFKPAEGATSLGGLAPSEYRPNFTEVFALRF